MFGLLQAKPERIAVLPVDQQQIAEPVAVDIDHLDGFYGAGERNLLRFTQSMVGILRKEVDIVLGQQKQISPAIAVQVSRAERIGRELPIVNRPALRGAPPVGALVIDDDEFLGLAVIGDIGAAIAVQVGRHQRRNTLLRRD